MERLFCEIQVNPGASGGWIRWPLKQPWGRGTLSPVLFWAITLVTAKVKTQGPTLCVLSTPHIDEHRDSNGNGCLLPARCCSNTYYELSY